MENRSAMELQINLYGFNTFLICILFIYSCYLLHICTRNKDGSFLFYRQNPVSVTPADNMDPAFMPVFTVYTLDVMVLSISMSMLK